MPTNIPANQFPAGTSPRLELATNVPISLNGANLTSLSELYGAESLKMVLSGLPNRRGNNWAHWAQIAACMDLFPTFSNPLPATSEVVTYYRGVEAYKPGIVMGTTTPEGSGLSEVTIQVGLYNQTTNSVEKANVWSRDRTIYVSGAKTQSGNPRQFVIKEATENATNHSITIVPMDGVANLEVTGAGFVMAPNGSMFHPADWGATQDGFKKTLRNDVTQMMFQNTLTRTRVSYELGREDFINQVNRGLASIYEVYMGDQQVEGPGGMPMYAMHLESVSKAMMEFARDHVLKLWIGTQNRNPDIDVSAGYGILEQVSPHARTRMSLERSGNWNYFKDYVRDEVDALGPYAGNVVYCLSGIQRLRAIQDGMQANPGGLPGAGLQYREDRNRTVDQVREGIVPGNNPIEEMAYVDVGGGRTVVFVHFPLFDMKFDGRTWMNQDPNKSVLGDYSDHALFFDPTPVETGNVAPNAMGELVPAGVDALEFHSGISDVTGKVAGFEGYVNNSTFSFSGEMKPFGTEVADFSVQAEFRGMINHLAAMRDPDKFRLLLPTRGV